jgi:hypothetical protein
MANQKSTVNASAPGKGQLWAGRILYILVLLFLAFDIEGKFVRPEYVVNSSAPVGITRDMLLYIGIMLLICTIFYVIPRTAVLGAAFLTGYLGGAVGIMFHAHMSPFMFSFPIIFAVFVWGNLWLRTPQLRAVFPLVSGKTYL